MSTLYHDRPFNVRYAVWEQSGRYGADLLRTHRTAKASWLYINRQHGIDDVGPTPDWSRRDDLIATGRVGPRRSQDLSLEGVALWTQADAHARVWRPDEPVCAHAVGSLPTGMDLNGWRNLIEGFAADHLASQGMICDWAIHHRPAANGQPEIMPHWHGLITTRVFDRSSPDLGRIRQTWVRTDKARRALAQRWWEHSGMYPSSYAMAA